MTLIEVPVMIWMIEHLHFAVCDGDNVDGHVTRFVGGQESSCSLALNSHKLAHNRYSEHHLEDLSSSYNDAAYAAQLLHALDH